MGTPLPVKDKVGSEQEYQHKIIVIAGPTGVGKTRLAIQLAKLLGGEVVSADSMQVYRGMDIGTAKATVSEREGIVHHLVDIRDLAEAFNVVDFYHEAELAIQSILARDRVPIVVGGTGFYIHALIYGPPPGPPASQALRRRLMSYMEKFGPEPLYERLKAMDPVYAETITRGDRQKIIRGLEIILQTKKPVSALVQEKKVAGRHHFRCWFLFRPKEVLYQEIDMRCDRMIALGLIDEVKALREKGLENNVSARRSIGYRQCLKYLKGECSFEACVQDFKMQSRRLAKRQLTWFRKESLFRWIDIDALGYDKTLELILHDFELS